MKIAAIIPARYQSSRFPGKPLALIDGSPMIERVYKQVLKANNLHQIIVATDDQRIFNLVKNFGGNVLMTKQSHQNGTERCAEIAEQLTDIDYFLNIQGDEPFIQPTQINLLIQKICTLKKGIATLVKKIDRHEDWLHQGIVKVLFDKNLRALYFSRAPLPYHHQQNCLQWKPQHHYYKHIGLYAYDRRSLLEISKLPPAPLELSESLEQLRWLENGHPISIAITPYESIAIDYPQDIYKAEKWLRNNPPI